MILSKKITTATKAKYSKITAVLLLAITTLSACDEKSDAFLFEPTGRTTATEGLKAQDAIWRFRYAEILADMASRMTYLTSWQAPAIRTLSLNHDSPRSLINTANNSSANEELTDLTSVKSTLQSAPASMICLRMLAAE